MKIFFAKCFGISLVSLKFFRDEATVCLSRRLLGKICLFSGREKGFLMLKSESKSCLIKKQNNACMLFIRESGEIETCCQSFLRIFFHLLKMEREV
jgi:hypothetical protein